jgi:hypothetical protein
VRNVGSYITAAYSNAVRWQNSLNVRRRGRLRPISAVSCCGRGSIKSLSNKGEEGVKKIKGLASDRPCHRGLASKRGRAVYHPRSKHKHVKQAEAVAFMDWLISPEGQAAIGNFTIEG